MFKRSFMSFAFLFIFWIAISGEVDLEHLVVGILLSGLIVWFWKDMNIGLPSLLSPGELLIFGRCIVMLLGYVIASSIDVAKIILFSSSPVSPMFLQMEPDIQTNWGRVFLATCITITPGTATVDFNPETNIYTVHALTGDMGKSLLHWKLIDEIKKLETLVQRRKTHVLDTNRVHDSDFIGPLESHDRTYHY